MEIGFWQQRMKKTGLPTTKPSKLIGPQLDFCDKHSRMNNWDRYHRKCIKAGTLEYWKRELFEELAAVHSNSHTGGGRKEKG